MRLFVRCRKEIDRDAKEEFEHQVIKGLHLPQDYSLHAGEDVEPPCPEFHTDALVSYRSFTRTCFASQGVVSHPGWFGEPEQRQTCLRMACKSCCTRFAVETLALGQHFVFFCLCQTQPHSAPSARGSRTISALTEAGNGRDTDPVHAC